MTPPPLLRVPRTLRRGRREKFDDEDKALGQWEHNLATESDECARVAHGSLINMLTADAERAEAYRLTLEDFWTATARFMSLLIWADLSEEARLAGNELSL